MGLISPLWPRARPSCGCRVNLSQMHWLEPDPLSQIPSCTLEPHEISKLKPSVIGVNPTLHKSNPNVKLWNVKRATWRNMCWWTRGDVQVKSGWRWNSSSDAELLFTVIVTVVGVMWNAAVNSSLSGAILVFFIFMRWRRTSVSVVDPYRNPPGTVKSSLEIYNLKIQRYAIFVYSLARCFPELLIRPNHTPGVHELSCAILWRKVNDLQAFYYTVPRGPRCS